MGSWHPRLGDLDKEIQNFLEQHEEFSHKNEKQFLKYAVREYMKNYKRQEKIDDELEEYIDKKIKESISED